MENTKADIRLKVQEMSTSIAFYRSIGFSIPEKVDTKSPIFIASDDSSLNLALIPADQIKDETNETYELIQIIYPNIIEVDQAYYKAACNGCKTVTKPWNTFWGTRSAKIIDPDGHNILLYTNIG